MFSLKKDVEQFPEMMSFVSMWAFCSVVVSLTRRDGPTRELDVAAASKLSLASRLVRAAVRNRVRDCRAALWWRCRNVTWGDPDPVNNVPLETRQGGERAVRGRGVRGGRTLWLTCQLSAKPCSLGEAEDPPARISKISLVDGQWMRCKRTARTSYRLHFGGVSWARNRRLKRESSCGGNNSPGRHISSFLLRVWGLVISRQFLEFLGVLREFWESGQFLA